MSHWRTLDLVLWLVQPFLQMGVLAAMYKRGLQRQYKYFFYYLSIQVLTKALLIAFRDNKVVYFYGYWSTLVLCIGFSFAVFLELFRDAFRPYEALRELSTILFRWCVLVVLLLGGMWAVTSIHTFDLEALMGVILLGDRSVRLMQCGMVFFLLLFSEYLGISRKNVMFGIAVGFGFFAAIDMLATTGLAHHSVVPAWLLRRLEVVAYDISVLIWLGYTALPATVRSREAIVAKSQDANYALEDVREQPATESLLDTMERTVERLLTAREEAKVSAAANSGSRPAVVTQKI
jgi:hypothetical protein